MSTIKNLHIYRDDLGFLRDLKEQYEFMGKPVKLEGNHLTVYATPPRKPSKKRDKNERHDASNVRQVSDNR